MNQTVEQVLMTMVELCERQSLDYAIMGGIAVRVHGIPRPTYDVDFELATTEAQLSVFLDQAERLEARRTKNRS